MYLQIETQLWQSHQKQYLRIKHKMKNFVFHVPTFDSSVISFCRISSFKNNKFFSFSSYLSFVITSFPWHTNIYISQMQNSSQTFYQHLCSFFFVPFVFIVTFNVNNSVMLIRCKITTELNRKMNRIER